METDARGDLVILPDPVALAEEGARRFCVLAQAAIADHGYCSVALSGGVTPRAMYERLSRPPYPETIDWRKVHVFWGDERYVPPDDPESSFAMARAALLAHVSIPAANIYPMPTVGSTPEAAADAYAQTLCAFFGADVPRFDLVLLGIGQDGHTASLFPGMSEVVSPSGKLVVTVHQSPKPPPTRLTCTFRVLNAASHVLFLVAGADKAAVLRAILHGPLDPIKLPAQGVRPVQGRPVWLVDAAAGRDS